jgi:hypothetical protein
VVRFRIALACPTMPNSDADFPPPEAPAPQKLSSTRSHLSSLNISLSFLRRLAKVDDATERRLLATEMGKQLEDRRALASRALTKRPAPSQDSEEPPCKRLRSSPDALPVLSSSVPPAPPASIIRFSQPRVPTKDHVFNLVWPKIAALHASNPSHPMFGTVGKDLIR